MSTPSKKRLKLSGAQYKKIRKSKTREAEKLSGTLLSFLKNEEHLSSPSFSTTLTGPGQSTSMTPKSDLLQPTTSQFLFPIVSTTTEEENAIGYTSESDKPIITSGSTTEKMEIETPRTPRGNSDTEICWKNLDFNNPVTWGTVTSRGVKVKDLIIEKGPISCELENDLYPFDINNRRFTNTHFYKIIANGEKVKRTWLIYSKTQNCIYCFCCKLFTAVNNRFTSGYSDWRNTSQSLSHHEKSGVHVKAFSQGVECSKRLSTHTSINAKHETILNKEKLYWRNVLHRIANICKTIAQLNLPFRGTSDVINTPNNGVFLKIIELFSGYDSILKEHVNRITNQKTQAHYLGKNIQNEVIHLLAEKAKELIVNKIKSALYYSVILDCTPDISHVEQLSIIIRFVSVEEKVQVEEHFIKFLPVEDTTGKGLRDSLFLELSNMNLSLYNCRGQGYDNGANMKGKHIGLQKLIINENPRAFYVPCSNHTLNLVLNDAASCNTEAVIFFDTIQLLYTFFSSSTSRWSVFKTHLKSLTLKPLSSTRWGSRIEAVRPLRFNLEKIYDALIEIIEDGNLIGTHGAKTRSEATGIARKLKSYTFICSLLTWYNVLNKINFASIMIQSVTCHLEDTTKIVENVIFSLRKIRNDEEFELMLNQATDIARLLEIEPQFEEESKIVKRRKKRCFEYEGHDDPILNQKQKFKVDVYFFILDVALQSATERFEQLQEHKKHFGFLYNIAQLKDLKKEELLSSCNNLETILTHNDSKDVDGKELYEEIDFISTQLKNSDGPVEVLDYIIRNHAQCLYPNCFVALRVLLTLPMSVASAERSFSRLKLIKTYLRSSMTQTRLTDLAMLSIEHDIVSCIDIDEIVTDFASKKARKAAF